MEPARTERAVNPDADKVRVDKIVRCKDKVKDVAGVARARAAAEVADKARAKVVAAAGAGKIVNVARTESLLPAASEPQPLQRWGKNAIWQHVPLFNP
ncbi:MAG: hypothetical protein LJE94_07315 [Deltaproteobacteria bacterium]|nr:hypothetical protein [Deltaproteobacteria bacterium]